MKSFFGYSLVEVSMVILVAALIIGTSIPVYTRIIDTKRIDLAVAEISGLQKDVDRFSRKNGRFPHNLIEVYQDNPIDPWGNPYHYTNIKNAGVPIIDNPRTDMNLKNLNADYDLYSDGADKASLSPVTANESRDDIIRAKNGNYIGVASQYR